MRSTSRSSSTTGDDGGASFGGLASARLAAVLLVTTSTSLAVGDGSEGDPTFVFSPAVLSTLPDPYFPTMFVARDLDRDGKVDLVVPGRDPEDRLLTLRGIGTGAFAIQQVLPAEGFVDWVDLVDLDGDRVDDLVAAWRGDLPRLVVYPGLGEGAFDAPRVVADVTLGMGRDPQGLAASDFDGDGDVDLAVASYVGQTVEIFSNVGSAPGTHAFERVARIGLARFIGGVAYPRVVAAGDVDGDGDPDLVINEIGGARVAVLRNEGGRFARAVEHLAPRIGSERPGMAGLVLADADRDGDLDVVVPALLLEGAQRAIVFVNDGSGGLASTRVVPGPAVGYAFATAVADFDGDGDLDLATGSALPGGVTFTRCDDAATGVYVRDALWLFGSLVRHVGAVDVDGDCDLDLVVIEGPSRTVAVRRNLTPQPGCGGVASITKGADGEDPGAEGADREAPPDALVAHGIPDLDRDGDRDAADLAAWLVGLYRTSSRTSEPGRSP